MATFRRSTIPQVLLVSMCSVLALAPSALGQARSEDPRAGARLRIGPVYATPTLQLKEFGLDSNVFNESGAGRKDFTMTVTPGITASLPFARRALLRLNGGADLVHYNRFASERSVNPGASLRGEAYFGRLTVFAQPSYRRARERPNFEIDKRSLRTVQGVGAGVGVVPTAKLALDFAATQERTSFDGDDVFRGTSLALQLNRRSRSYEGAVRWKKSSLTTFLSKVTVAQDRFSESEVRNTDSTRAVVGAALKPQALIAGYAEAGFINFHTLAAELPNFTGVVAAASLSYSLRGATALAAKISRDPAYSADPFYPYYIDNSYGFSVRRQLRGQFDATVDFERHRYSYRKLGSPHAESGGSRRETTDGYTALIGYRVGRGARIGLGVTYWSRAAASESSVTNGYQGFRLKTTFAYGI